MEDLLLRTCCACLEELTEIRRELRAVNDRVCALDEYVAKLDGTVPPSGRGSAAPSRRPQEASSAEHEAGGLRELCVVQDRALHGIFMEACEDGQLCMELRALAERAYSSFPGGKCASACGWLQGALLSELRRGNLRAVAFQAAPNAGSLASVGKVSRVCRVNDVEAALIKQLQSPTESQDIAVIFSPIFGQSCWQLLEAVLCWCRRERLTARMDLAHGMMRSFLRDGDGLRDIDLLVLIRSASLQSRAAVHLEERGDVVLQSTIAVPAASDAPFPHYRTETHEDMIRQAKSGSSGDAELLLAAEKAAASHIAELQILGGGGVPSFDILSVMALLRTPHFAQAAEVPSLLRSALAGAVVWAYEARREELAGAGQVEAQTFASNSNSCMEGQSEAFAEAMQAPLPVLAQPPLPVATAPSPLLQASLLAEHKVHISEVQAAQTMPTLSVTTAAATAIAAGERADQADSNSESSIIEDDSPAQVDGSWSPSSPTRGTSHVEQQAAFIKCFNDELVGQRPLLLSQLNNLYKMRSGEELNYKASGYEKLRDFLMDIPGLMLLGRGNRMQVRLSDPAEFEAFQERLGRLAEAKTSQLQFRMPKPLPESLQQRLLELFLNAEGHEILLKNFLNAWNYRYPTEQLAYRSLGFRDVRGLLCNVPFLEKVGGKTDARYVLRCNDDLQHMLNKTAQAESTQAKSHMVQANGVQHTSQPISLATQTSQGRMTPAPMEPLSIDYFSGSGAKTAPATPVGRAFNGNPMLVRPRYEMQNLSPGRVDLQGHGGSTANMMQAQRMPTASNTRPPQSNSSTPLAGMCGSGPVFASSPLASSGMGVGIDLGITGTDPPKGEGMSAGRMLHGNGNASATGPTTSALGGKSTPPFVPGGLLTNTVNTVTKVQGSGQPNHGSTALVPPPPAHWPETPSLERGVPAAVPLTDGPPAHLSNKLLVNGRWVQNGRQGAEDSSPTRGAIRGFGGAATGFGQGGLPGVNSLGGIHSLGSSPGLGASDLELSGSLILPTTVVEDRREDDSGNTESEGLFNEHKSRANVTNLDSTSEHSISKVARKSGRRLDRKNKNASFFVSSPGAFSSETRDASIHQGKFDMSTVLQTQLRQGSPCLVCDISGGQVMVTNTECEDLFESVDLKRQLVQCDIFSLIHQDDRDKFSTFFAYLMVSERSRMDPFEIRIVTMLGHTRKVRAEGVQLIGVWWQFDFFDIGDADLSKDDVES
mmetsp:Transcript_115395/g.203684  ORF Transcript_115395/g.203684 Transcript_115395/m.203684 type:complete len:1219 (+) Transcript_115395:108-3764(+)